LSLIKWISRLFKSEPQQEQVNSQQEVKPEPKSQQSEGTLEGAQEEELDEIEFPRKATNINNLDNRKTGSMSDKHRVILNQIGRMVESKEYHLPNLPSTSAAVLDFSSDPSVDIVDISKAIEADPVLSSELLKVANSAFYGCVNEATTIHQAVMRLGVREMRALILALSMKNVISKAQGLLVHAEEVWRQSLSVAKISRKLATTLGMDSDRAFLSGLLHNIGKVALLDIIGKTVKSGMDRSRSLIGRVYHLHHEEVGRAMAEKWKLPQEVASVAGCHHDFINNEDFPKSAGLVSFAHKIDLFLSLGSRVDYMNLKTAEEVEYLGLNHNTCTNLLQDCIAEFFNETGQEDTTLMTNVS